MRALGDCAGDFIDVKLHGLGVGMRQGERRACAPRRTNGAEQIGALIALVGRLAGPRSAPRPLPHETVLLADPRLILEPDFDRLAPRDVGQMGVQRGGEVFLNVAMIRSSCALVTRRALIWEKPSALRILPTVRSW